MVTKKQKHTQKPGAAAHKTTFGGNKTTRKSVDGTLLDISRILILLPGPTRLLSLAPRSLDTDLISVPQLLPAHLPSVSLSVPRRIPQRQRSVEQRQRRRLLRRTSKFGWA